MGGAAIALWLVGGATPAIPASAPDATATATATARAATGRIDVEFQDASLERVFRVFSDIGQVNIVPEPGLSGTVTARLRDVDWLDALEMIVCAQGLEMMVDRNVIYVRRARPPGTPWTST